MWVLDLAENPRVLALTLLILCVKVAEDVSESEYYSSDNEGEATTPANKARKTSAAAAPSKPHRTDSTDSEGGNGKSNKPAATGASKSKGKKGQQTMLSFFKKN